MFGGTRALSDRQNALVRQFRPFGHPIGQQFSLVVAVLFAAKLAQRDGRVHIVATAETSQLDKLNREPIRQRIDFLELQQADGAHDRALITKHAASYGEAQPCNR